jgi:hypothetical protein
MKKVFALLAIVGFVACNNAETPAAGPDTTTQAYKDSVAAANAPKVDSPAVTVDSPAVKVDSPAVAK